jgi:1,4-dihydroxy-2-naphthoyl-CoA synthase
MTYETLIYKKQDRICTITLNRPHRLNALSPGLVGPPEIVNDPTKYVETRRLFRALGKSVADQAAGNIRPVGPAGRREAAAG